jgi:hypothetical protein
MKVIFLDIDGVLNSELWYKRRYESDVDDIHENYPYYEFDPNAITHLNHIIKSTDAKIVVSSTWRIGRSVVDLHKLLSDVGVVGEVIDKTPNFFARGLDNDENAISYTVPRGCEIDWWLKNKGMFQRINWSVERQNEMLKKSLVKNYIILDDDSDMLYSQREHFVKTQSHSGLTSEVAEKAIKILNTPITQLYYESTY